MSLWSAVAAEMDGEDVETPFWAFAWVGGQAVARYVLDHPDQVQDKWVLDFAAGSGICGIAAARAGAREVLAADTDPFAAAAVALNGLANGVALEVVAADLTATEAPPVDIILAGDVCYERGMSQRVLPWLRAACAAGITVLIGDPGRPYFQPEGMVRLAEYVVPTSVDIEDSAVKATGVFALQP
jgi:predicted nicotinamide N-methyase